MRPGGVLSRFSGQNSALSFLILASNPSARRAVLMAFSASAAACSPSGSISGPTPDGLHDDDDERSCLASRESTKKGVTNPED
jgi:hypothetical protein